MPERRRRQIPDGCEQTAASISTTGGRQLFRNLVGCQIINILFFNADTTNRELASKCNIALGTVNNRINKLKQLGVIKSKTIIVDYEKLGYQIEVMIDLKIKKGRFNEVAKSLSSNPNVFMLINMTGDYDAEFLARFHNRSQLNSFIKKLQNDESVEDTRTRLVLDIYREKEVK